MRAARESCQRRASPRRDSPRPLLIRATFTLPPSLSPSPPPRRAAAAPDVPLFAVEFYAHVRALGLLCEALALAEADLDVGADGDGDADADGSAACDRTGCDIGASAPPSLWLGTASASDAFDMLGASPQVRRRGAHAGRAPRSLPRARPAP